MIQGTVVHLACKTGKLTIFYFGAGICLISAVWSRTGQQSYDITDNYSMESKTGQEVFIQHQSDLVYMQTQSIDLKQSFSTYMYIASCTFHPLLLKLCTSHVNCTLTRQHLHQQHRFLPIYPGAHGKVYNYGKITMHVHVCDTLLCNISPNRMFSSHSQKKVGLREYRQMSTMPLAAVRLVVADEDRRFGRNIFNSCCR